MEPPVGLGASFASVPDPHSRLLFAYLAPDVLLSEEHEAIISWVQTKSREALKPIVCVYSPSHCVNVVDSHYSALNTFQCIFDFSFSEYCGLNVGSKLNFSCFPA